SYYLEDRPYNDEAVQKAMAHSKTAADAAKNAEATFRKTKDEAIAEEEAVKSIVAGQMERKNWLELLTFINEAVPKPDGSNLTPEMKRSYWEGKDAEPDSTRPDYRHGAMTGKRAWEEYHKREQAAKMGLSEEAGDEMGPGVNDLVLYNIEAIDCR